MDRRIAIRKRLCLFSIIVFFISGCASVRHAVPEASLNSARISGMQDIRAFSGSPSDPFKRDFVKLLEQEEKGEGSFFDFNSKQTFYMLAIS